METAKIFMNGRSQAIRLPKEFRFEGDEVFIKKVQGGVMLIPKDKSVWEEWKQTILSYDEPFMLERNQPEVQHREGLDEVFD